MKTVHTYLIQHTPSNFIDPINIQNLIPRGLSCMVSISSFHFSIRNADCGEFPLFFFFFFFSFFSLSTSSERRVESRDQEGKDKFYFYQLYIEVLTVSLGVERDASLS